jgi:hypothetical protein
MSSKIYIVNCAFTHRLTKHLLDSIKEIVGDESSPSIPDREVKVFIGFSGFKNGHFNGRTLEQQIKDFSVMPSNLRFRFDNTDENGIPRVSGLNHKTCQKEITDATFNFFQGASKLQRLGKNVEIIFTAMTRQTRPFTLVITVKDEEVSLGANNNIKQNLYKYNRSPPYEELKKIRPGEEYKNLEEYSDVMVTIFVRMLSDLCGSELNSVFGKLCSEKITSKDANGNPVSKIQKKQLAHPVLCWEGKNDVSEYNDSRITYLADVFGMAASLLYLTERDTYFGRSQIKALKIQANNSKCEEDDGSLFYTTFITENVSRNVNIRGESELFRCYHLKESELSKPEAPRLPLDLLSKVMEIMYKPTVLSSLNSAIEVFRDDGINDIDDYVLGKIFDRQKMFGLLDVRYSSNNSFTSGILKTKKHNKLYLSADDGTKVNSDTLSSLGVSADQIASLPEQIASLRVSVDEPNTGSPANASTAKGGKKKKSSTSKKKKSSISKKKKLSTSKKKVIRKHQGIYQSGPKAGRLKPGYRYTGQKTSTGLKVIAKKVSKK